MDDLRVLQRYHAVLRPFLAVLAFSILFDIAIMGLGLSAPLFTRLLFDYAYPYRDLALLNTAIGAVVVLSFLSFFLGVASDYLQIYVNQEATASLTERVFHHLQRLPLPFHQEKKAGDLLLRITDDVARTVGMVANVLPTLAVDGGRLLAILAIALLINPRLTLLALIAFPLYFLEARFYAWRQARTEREMIDADAAILSRAQERLVNIRTVKAFGQERHETLSFSILLRRRYRVAIKGRLLEVVRTFTNSLTLQMWGLFLMWYLSFEVVQGRLTVGEIVALLLYFEQMGDPLRSLIALFSEWKRSLVSMRRLDEVLEEPAEEDDAPREMALGPGEVRASHLSFAYRPTEEVLHGVDVAFPPRSMTAIVGASGSGKTTLANLLLRFFRPSDGVILIDGQDIAEVRVHSLRGKVGIVQQDATLFDDTIMNNILYGNEGMERGDAMRAARCAGAHDFIERLPGGYDAPSGAGGSLLSGGQRQRIAIARTLLRNPAIILFDEATSALDAESEYRIHETVSALKQSKTVIVIAHRLSTIKSADTVLVLEEGRFVERGTFDELMEARGAFSRYYWRQFGGLAPFRRQLELELERAARYRSKFCLAALTLQRAQELELAEGPLAAERFTDEVDLLLKKHMRMGDLSVALERGTILVLLPEIDEEQLRRFFQRMRQTLPRTAGKLSPPLGEADLRFLGTRITQKGFRTAEDLLAALVARAREERRPEGATIVPETALAAELPGGTA